ncbi:YCF49-like protein [Hirschfeldia incana]|nr:YCF49-like protein [Hirschfeldia incana]KAJ0239555.1 YCF49-like protein [Hirschfeldia incana]
MAIASTSTLIFSCAKPDLPPTPSHFRFSSPSPLVSQLRSRSLTTHDPISLPGLIGTGLVAATFMAGGHDSTAMAAVDALQLSEPANALSLPTWAVHVSSVVEWITAMALVWKYGERKGYESWKGLSWGMVPLLGGALCACTWHFFYNAESLEVLVALQGALTVIGNITLCIAAFRINKSTSKMESPEEP